MRTAPRITTSSATARKLLVRSRQKTSVSTTAPTKRRASPFPLTEARDLPDVVLVIEPLVEDHVEDLAWIVVKPLVKSQVRRAPQVRFVGPIPARSLAWRLRKGDRPSRLCI
jgi:hypothetical protein